MRKLLSTTALAAMLALGGGAWAQQAATPGSTPGSGGAVTGQAAPGQAGPGQAAPGQATTGQAPASAGRAAGGASGAGTTASPTGMMTEEQVRTRLTAEGFGNVQNITRDGNNYRATAMQNGRPVDVSIDVQTGAIRSQAASR